MLKELILTAKKQSAFELDGVVLSVNDYKISSKMGQSSTGQQDHSRKFKIADNEAITEVVDVIWANQTRLSEKLECKLKELSLPALRLHLPLVIMLKIFAIMVLEEGAIVKITRAGDVIPKILERTVKKVAPKLPGKEFGEFYWSENDVDLILVNAEENDEVRVNLIEDAFDRLEIAALREASCQKLYDAGLDTVAKIIKATKHEFVDIIGVANGTKIFDSLHEKLQNVDPAVLAAASQCFGRGIGTRKITKLFKSHDKIQGLTLDQILATESFSDITANMVLTGLPKYDRFLEEIKGYYTLEKKEKVMGGDFDGMVVVFTGYRSKEAEKEIEQRGGTIGSSVSSKTTHLVAKDKYSDSGKMQKARAQGIKILSAEDLGELLNNG